MTQEKHIYIYITNSNNKNKNERNKTKEKNMSTQERALVGGYNTFGNQGEANADVK